MTYVHLDWFSENVDLAHATAKEKGLRMSPTLVAITMFCAKTAYRSGTIPLTQVELAEKVGNSPNSMPPLMAQLVELGIVFKATDKRYALGSWWNHMNYDQGVQFRDNAAPWVERVKPERSKSKTEAQPSSASTPTVDNSEPLESAWRISRGDGGGNLDVFRADALRMSLAKATREGEATGYLRFASGILEIEGADIPPAAKGILDSHGVQVSPA